MAFLFAIVSGEGILAISKAAVLTNTKKVTDFCLSLLVQCRKKITSFLNKQQNREKSLDKFSKYYQLKREDTAVAKKAFSFLSN